MLKLLIVVAVLLGYFALLVSPSRADGPPKIPTTYKAPYTTYPTLDALASVFSMRPVQIHCTRVQDDWLLGRAWGYTVVKPEWNFAVMQAPLCNAAIQLAAGMPVKGWLAALSVLVLVHESYHMRRWDLRANEAVVECRAIRHWQAGMRLLRVPQATIEGLKPWALAEHFRQEAKLPEYAQRSCLEPWPW